MMRLTLRVVDEGGRLLSEAAGEGTVHLVYRQEYREGDRLELACSQENSYLMLQLDEVMNPSFVYLKDGAFSFLIPFGEKRVSYSPKTFMGGLHLLSVRPATEAEIGMYKNLAQNEYDCHENKSCFPHAYANVETRGEAVFAARNAINGNTENHSHGEWPYESWGINRNPDAEITVDFGRTVCIDRVVLVTRADFPHDNWWKQGELTFSDGSTVPLSMEKSDQPHQFSIPPRRVEWVKLGRLIKDESDPSPFPALTQIEVYGTEVPDQKE